MDLITRYARQNQIIYTGNSLNPDRTANCFFNGISVNSYCQQGNRVEVANTANVSTLMVGDGILNTTTNAFATVMATSNNYIYLDQNYITINVTPYAANTLAANYYAVGDLVYQQVLTRTNSYGQTAPGPKSYYRYSSWVNNFAVDVATSETRSYKVSFDTAGTYYLYCAADDYASVYVDGALISSPYKNWTYNAYASGSGVAFTITTAGVHTVSYSATNTGGNGAFAAVITTASGGTGSGTTVFNARFPPGLETIQTSTVFEGRVAYWNYATGILAIVPELGTFRSGKDGVDSTIRKINSTILSNVSTMITGSTWDTTNSSNTNIIIPQKTPFPAGSNIIKTKDSSFVDTVIAYEHRSGGVLDVKSSTSGNTLYAQGNVSSTIIGKEIKIVSGTGYGASRTISAVSNGNQITVSTNFPALSSNSRYSIGPQVVDDYGVAAGVFNIPEYNDAKFPAGEGLFVITDTATADDNNYLMRCSAKYTVTTGGYATPLVPTIITTTVAPPFSSAIPYQTDPTGAGNWYRYLSYGQPVNTVSAVNPTVPSRRYSWTATGFDPVAQTFFVPSSNTLVNGEVKTSYGIYVSSVDLWFATKPTSYSDIDSKLSVTVRIVEVENEVPTNNIIAEKNVPWSSVNLSTIPSANNSSTATKFKFNDPVYLENNTTYAITISSDSPEYSVYVAEVGGSVLGSNPARRISDQPYVGLLYKSQNASLWSPILTQDLMFRINKCSFVTSGAITTYAKPAYSNIAMDSVVISSTEYDPKPTTTKYKMSTTDTFGNVLPYTYIPVNTMYNFGSDLAISSVSTTSSRQKVVVAGSKESMNVAIELSTTDSDVSPIINKERLNIITYENVINNASLSNNVILIMSGGLHRNTANINVAVSSPDTSSGVTAKAYAMFGGSISANNIVIDAGGSGYGNTTNIIFSAPPAPYNTANNTANGYITNTLIGTSAITQSLIVIDKAGAGYFNVCPTITFSGGGGTGAKANVAQNVAAIIMTDQFGNIVTDSGSGYLKTPTISISEANNAYNGAYANATAIISGETGSSGGNCLVRYVTKRVDLADGFDAGDLVVYLDCIRPQGTDINVYYKVKSAYDSDTFDAKKWQLMSIVSNNYSKDQNQTIELQFKPSLTQNQVLYRENGVDYPLGGKFKSYAIKIVMTAANPTVAPSVSNLTAIATPSG